MALKSNSVWAVDIGNTSLKALHLGISASGAVEVIGFDNIQHGKILSGGGVKGSERDELIALSLRQLVKQNDLSKDDVVVSVPSQNSFARFVTLPPVEAKRIPEIVKFEAVQQIPFDIDDVQWDWQLMTTAEVAENRVGIFAIKSDIVSRELEHFSSENMRVVSVQMAPMALYNYLVYDRPDLVRSDEQATVILNIGAENTDLVVCTKSTVWQRSVPMGGNAFTRAIADTFKLNFKKAEKLKRTSPMSKYARQVFQAMRPVFTDLSSEIQRSLGFYNSSNPNTKLSRIVALGGGTKMRGLLKYLQQSLQIPVERPDSFKRLVLSPSVSAAKFHESVCDFGIVYGLALQGLGLGRIESNLLPRSIARSMAWAGKVKYFIAAASVVLVVSLMCFARTYLDGVNYRNDDKVRQDIDNTIRAAAQAVDKYKGEESKGSAYEAVVKEAFEPFKYRRVVPLLHETIISCLLDEETNPEQKELYRAFTEGDVETVLEIPRRQRKQIFVTNMSVYFSDNIADAKFGQVGSLRGISGRDREGQAPADGRAATPAGTSDRRPKYQRQKYGKSETRSSAVVKKAAAKKQEKLEERPGFVVTVEGYSPYENIYELMDPAGVRDDKSKWGFITRLMHLDEIFDGNSPFELFHRTNIEQFQLEVGEVEQGASSMPAGIGVEDVKAGKADSTKAGKPVLVDPMTKEVISKVAELDEYGKEKTDILGKQVYRVNDCWFRLNAKFVWKDAPKK